ncbi:MAG: hypothetical protein AAGF31_03890 [Planctomycetota bacterium]
MKKFALLLAVAMLTSSLVGCGCCRRVRSLFNRGAFCGTPAAAAIAAPPQSFVIPAPAPVVVPQASCDPCCVPCQPCCDPCVDCCPTPTSYGPIYDSGCDCVGTPGTIQMGTIQQGVVDPGPIPAGP